MVALIHAVVDAASYEQAEAALVILRSHPQGAAISQFLNEHLDRILVHLVAYYAGLQRVTPEWYWRDFRLRLSGGRNPGTYVERAARSGPSTIISSPPNGGVSANAIIATPARAPCKWPAHHRDK